MKSLLTALGLTIILSATAHAQFNGPYQSPILNNMWNQQRVWNQQRQDEFQRNQQVMQDEYRRTSIEVEVVRINKINDGLEISDCTKDLKVQSDAKCKLWGRLEASRLDEAEANLLEYCNTWSYDWNPLGYYKISQCKELAPPLMEKLKAVASGTAPSPLDFEYYDSISDSRRSVRSLDSIVMLRFLAGNPLW